MKTLVLILSLLVSIDSLAQKLNKTHYLYHLGTFEPGSEALVFATQCNLRAKPAMIAKVVDTLFIGQKVQVIEQLSTEHTVNGVTRNWIKVKVNNKEGYIWGGNLSQLWQRLSPTETVIGGVSHMVISGDQKTYFASLRICKGAFATIIKEFELKQADMPESGYLVVIDQPKLDSVEKVIIYATMSEACGVFASDHTFLYNGKSLFMVGSGYGMSDAGVMHTSKCYQFPIDREVKIEDEGWFYQGSRNFIKRTIENGEYDNDCEFVTTTKVQSFFWNGSSLEKYCGD